MSGSTGRQFFSESEKLCLQKLIIKYKLNTASTIHGSPATKKMAWVRLTEEYNSIETNTKRTEAQLKKCWDNLKTRRKSVLAQEKRERMKTGGGSFDPQPSTSTAMTSQVLDEALLETTDVELQFVIDSDSVPNPLETQENRDIMMSTVIDPIITLNEPSTQEEQVRERDTPPRRSGSRLTDYGGSTSQPQFRQTNIRSRVIQDEFTIRQNMYKRKEEREEDLHKLYVAEQQWKVKAAEEYYLKNKIEREAAEELLLCNRIKRETAQKVLEK